MMNINQQKWALVGKQAAAFANLPGWVQSICEKSFDEMFEENAINLETEVLEQSYIDFLQEQIELNARGEDWTALLRKRQEALSPWVGKETLVLSISDRSRSLRIRFEPSRSQVVWVEAFNKV